MIRTLVRFGNLPPAHRWLLLQAAIVLPLTVLGLRVFGLNRCWRLLRRLPAARQAGEHSASSAQALSAWRAVTIAARRGLVAGNCLSRSLTLWWLLRGQGIAGDLRIGVRRADGLFGAHAWVEVAGQPINEETGVYGRYRTFAQAIQPVQERLA